MKVTSHKTQIQALLADIDSLLGKTGGRLSWGTARDAAGQRQILDRVRDFLVSLLQEEYPPLMVGTPGELPSKSEAVQDQILQALLQQLGDRFSRFMQPLQAELETLLSQRQALLQEIRQLELHRQQDYSLTQQQANQQQMIAEFLQVLSSHLQESLKQQLAQTLVNLEAQFSEIEATSSELANSGLANSGQYTPEAAPTSHINSNQISMSPPLHPRARVEQLQSLQSELDRRIQSLDSTINVVFDTLQRNVQTYQQSLSQALEKMYQTGVQGEQMFATLVNQMAQQSATGTSPGQADSPTPADSESGVGTPSNTPYFYLTNNLPQLELPYPGTELLGQTSPLRPQPASPSFGLGAIPLSGMTAPPRTAADNPPSYLPKLDSSELDFSSLEASASDIDEINTLIQSSSQSDSQPQAEATVLQSPAEEPGASTGEAQSELDFILEQLGLDLTTSTSDADLEIRQSGQVPQDDVNELYESLFGSGSSTVTEEQSGTGLPMAAGEPTTAPPAKATALNKSEASTTDTALETQHNLPEALPDPIIPSSTGLLASDQPGSADTIAALTDLRWNTDSSEVVQSNLDSPGAEDQTNRADTSSPSIPQPVTSDGPVEVEDSYTPASPTENLLVPEGPESESVYDILLDLETLEQLNEDLSNMEKPEVELPATSVQPPAATEVQELRPSSQGGSAEVSSPSEPTIPTSSSTPLDTTSSPNQTSPETEKKKLIQTDFYQTEQYSLSSASTVQADDPCAFAPNTSSALLMREDDVSTDSWFLGIDIGTTGLSAALSNHSTGELYPLYWSAHEYPDTVAATRSFRLPAVAFLPAREEMASVPPLGIRGRGDGEMGSEASLRRAVPSALALSPLGIRGRGDREVGQLATASMPVKVRDYASQGVLIKNLKPYLKVGIPYHSPATGNCEPVLQLNDQQTISLGLCVSLLSTLLATLNPASVSGANSAGVIMPVATVAATGMEPQTLRAVLGRVTAVVFSCPDGWSEQYRFNLREAVLNAQLVARPEQVLFIEEAIAAVLSQLGASSCKSLELPGPSRKRTEESRWQGGTLVINAGATMTELATVDLPENLQTLAHSDFTLHSLPYAGNAIDQDIICQLLYPQTWQQPPSSNPNNVTWSKDGWSWQSRLPNLDQLHWDSLQLEQLDLPQPGEPDLPARIKLQQRLESSLLGQALLEAAGHLKLILQHEEQFTLSLADRQWNLQRRDLETLVFLPFVRRLNRELNRLLVATGMPVEAINQVICTGGTASLSAIARWLRQKLPKATIIQDMYRSDHPYACSRVAYGLAMLPLLPQVLEEHRQQYSDYFLLLELLRSLTDASARVSRPYRLSEIILLLEGRGINTRACQHRLMPMLEGQLPPGLVPSFTDACWLTQASQQNLDYQTISAAPLFERQANLLYRPNPQQMRSLCHYLSTILTDTHQKLEEPCAFNFFVS